MKTIYGPAVREQVLQRMSPPNRESVAEIARSTDISVPTLISWPHRWQLQGQLVPANSKGPQQWSAADKLASIIEAAAPSCTDFGSFCRQLWYELRTVCPLGPNRRAYAWPQALNMAYPGGTSRHDSRADSLEYGT